MIRKHCIYFNFTDRLVISKLLFNLGKKKLSAPSFRICQELGLSAREILRHKISLSEVVEFSTGKYDSSKSLLIRMKDSSKVTDIPGEDVCYVIDCSTGLIVHVFLKKSIIPIYPSERFGDSSFDINNYCKGV